MLYRPPYISIALLSAAALAYEILLIRLFSIIQWHHFSFMIIALALLGYGASGSIVSVAQKTLSRHYNKVYLYCITLFSLSGVFCFQLAQNIQFNAEEILWNKWQVVYLSANFLLLMLPFFFAATAICLSFMKFPKQISKLYAVDLVGAGTGSLMIVLSLFIVTPIWALTAISISGLIAAIIAIYELKICYKQIITPALIIGIGILLLISRSLELHISPYKSYPRLYAYQVQKSLNNTQVHWVLLVY